MDKYHNSTQLWLKQEKRKSYTYLVHFIWSRYLWLNDEHKSTFSSIHNRGIQIGLAIRSNINPGQYDRDE